MFSAISRFAAVPAFLSALLFSVFTSAQDDAPRNGREPLLLKEEQAFHKIMDMRRIRLRQEDYKGLLKLYDFYPENYKFSASWEKLQALRERDREMVKKKVADQKDAMNALVAANKLKEALESAKRIEQKFPEDMLQKADFDKNLKQIKDAIAKQEKAKDAKLPK